MLPFKDKILFAIGGIGENITFQALSAWLMFFWAGRGDPANALVPIGLLGILFGAGRFIEAFDDPIIGYLSDKTRSRWGRRFPYIFFGAPVVTVSFFLLWTPPDASASALNAVYFFLILQIFFLSYTIVSAPYEGILPEIAKTAQERVSTSAWRVFFGVIGAGMGLVGSSLLIERYGFTAMAAIIGIAGLIAFWVAALGIRKRLAMRAEAAEMNLAAAVSATIGNGQFLIFSFAFILFSLGLNLLTALLPFYVRLILHESEGMVALFSGLLLASMVTALPLHNALAAKRNKKWAYAASMLALALTFPLLAFVGLMPLGNAFVQTAVLVTLIGIALAGQFVFPNAILADIIDYDAGQTGLRREAIYYGMQNTLQKFSFALAVIIFGATLSFFGGSAENTLGLRLIGPIAGIAALAGFFIFVKKYTLTEYT